MNKSKLKNAIKNKLIRKTFAVGTTLSILLSFSNAYADAVEISNENIENDIVNSLEVETPPEEPIINEFLDGYNDNDYID